MTRTAIFHEARARIPWGLLAAALIVAGFALDGTTEAGHHLFLILGGVAVGYGVARQH
jgi:hypothetical protein